MNGRKGAALVAVLGSAAVGAVIVAAPTSVNAVERVAFATNAERVGGWKVSQTPAPNSLVPLNGKGKLPAGAMNYRLAPGETITGSYGGTFQATAQGQLFGIAVDFPNILTKGLGKTDSGIAGGGIELPECEGSYDAPTAPPGKLCLYPGPQGSAVTEEDPEVINVRVNGEGAYEANVYPIGRKQGFRVEWQANGAGGTRFYGVWAYTQPDKSAEQG